MSFNKFDEFMYPILNYIVAFGWLIPLWIPVYQKQLFFTWLGFFMLVQLMRLMKDDNQEVSRKPKQRGKAK